MPKPRERDPSDKIKTKGKSNGRPARDVRRPDDRQAPQGAGGTETRRQEPPADVQAVDQIEQTAAAAFDKVEREAEQLIDRAIHPDRRPKERTDAIKGDGQRPQERRPVNGSSRTARKTGRGQNRTAQGRKDAVRPPGAKTGAVGNRPGFPFYPGEPDTPPTPQERMKRQAAKDLEHAGYTGELPQGRGAPHSSPHYGGPSAGGSFF